MCDFFADYAIGCGNRSIVRNRTSAQYQKPCIVKTLTGDKKISAAVNDKNRKPTNERSERMKLRKEHFEIFNILRMHIYKLYTMINSGM